MADVGPETVGPGNPTLPKYCEYFRKLPELFNYPILRKLKHWRDDVSAGAAAEDAFSNRNLHVAASFRRQSASGRHLRTARA